MCIYLVVLFCVSLFSKINKNQKYKLTLNSLSPEGRDLMETSHLELSVLRSLTLPIVLCGFLDFAMKRFLVAEESPDLWGQQNFARSQFPSMFL